MPDESPNERSHCHIKLKKGILDNEQVETLNLAFSRHNRIELKQEFPRQKQHKNKNQSKNKIHLCSNKSVRAFSSFLVRHCMTPLDTEGTS